MIIAWLIKGFVSILTLLMAPLQIPAAIFNAAYAPVNTAAQTVAVWFGYISIFVNLSTFFTCFGIICALELLIVFWEAFSTFVLRK